MSKFNTTKVNTTKTVNLAGGEAFIESPELELISILLTSFVQDQVYRSADDTVARVKQIITQLPDKKFAAQAAIYARKEFHMRSITHVVASEIAHQVKGADWTKRFYSKAVERVDDITEILAYYLTNYSKPLPNSLKKGLATAINKFDAYQLAKYRGEGKSVSLVDAVNLLHPTPKAANAEAITALMKGELKSTETWEAKLSEIGQGESSIEEKEEAKGQAWAQLLRDKKLGYMALLRNLRNILTQAEDSLDEALKQLTDPEFIARSKVLPFRFITALGEIEKLPTSSKTRAIVVALNEALEIACKNVPHYDGETLIAIDVSGSMESSVSGDMSCGRVAALFGAILAKANNADCMIFNSTARYVNVNPSDSISTIQKQLQLNDGGTDFHSIFKTANKKYDRIMILSDMQGWIGYNSPAATFKSYKNFYKADPKIYSFDLAGYGTLQFPERNVYALAGFSDKVFDLMETLDQDRNALVNKMKSIEI